MPRTWMFVAAPVLIVLVLGAWLGSGWGLGTCGAFDRWSGNSGCVARHTVTDLRPLAFVSMMPVDERHVRIFGLTERGENLVPAQLVVNIQNGVESERQDLPLQLSQYGLVPSQTGQKIAVICITNDACDAANPKGYVLSVADGSVVEPLPDVDYFRWHFPGERPRTTFSGAWISDTVSAEPDIADGTIVLLDQERALIGHFTPADPAGHGGGPSGMAVRISSSGKYLAMIDSSRLELSRIDIYDVASRRLLNTITTYGDRKVDTNAVWLADEHLVMLQDRGAIPAGARSQGTELYVFKVR